MFCWVLWIFLSQAAVSGKDAPLPSFADFPIQTSFHGTPAEPLLKTAGQRLFRTRIREAARKGPNFAGHYTIAEWGCGASCVSLAVIDAETGAVFEGPFGSLPKAVLSYGIALKYAGEANDKNQAGGLSYNPKSRLLIARGCPNEADCGSHFYEWTGAEFKLVRMVAATPQHP